MADDKSLVKLVSGGLGIGKRVNAVRQVLGRRRDTLRGSQIMQHPGVTCPLCECWKSPKKLYKSEDTAKRALGKKHSTRCNECGTVFEYTPQMSEIKTRRMGIPGLFKITNEIAVTEMVIVEEGEF